MGAILSILFPFQSGVSSFPRPATGDDAIRSSIIQILTTKIGERVNRPTFGSKIWDFVFENDSEATTDGIEREVRTALGLWEPRIAVNAVQTEFEDDVNEPSQIIVTIFYTSLLTGQNNSVTIAG